MRLVGEVSGREFEWQHQDTKRDRYYTYALVAVDKKGKESRPVYFSLR